MSPSGSVAAISTSSKKGTKKTNVESAVLRENYGIEGDAHAGNWERQISFLDLSSVQKMQGRGMEINPGDFAENITTKSISFAEAKLGDIIKIGESVRICITKKGKECHDRCEIYKTVGDCIMPKEGVFGKVLSGGTIRVGDSVSWE